MAHRWQRLLYGFWFVPGLVVVALAVLALVLIEVDRRALPSGVPVLFDGSGPGARSILGTVATAIATTAGVVFSITIVTLQLVSTQFTPRTLRGFLEDRVTQCVAGLFAGTFVYCLLVLRVVRDQSADSGTYVPALAVTGAVVLGVLSLAALLLFVHHVSTSIQVATIAARTARHVSSTIARRFPEPFGHGQPVDVGRVLEDWRALGDRVEARAPRTGFVESADLESFAGRLAAGTRVEFLIRPGDFVVAGGRIANVYGPHAGDAQEAVEDAVVMADERDSAQDVDYGLQRLADIAVAALAPGINDPGTAVVCTEYVAAVMQQLAGRADPAPLRRLAGDVEVLAEPRPFTVYVDTTFVAIGRDAARVPSVADALLRGMGRCRDAALAAGAHDRARAIQAAAEDVGRVSLEHAVLEHDRVRLGAALAGLRHAELIGSTWGTDEVTGAGERGR